MTLGDYDTAKADWQKQPQANPQKKSFPDAKHASHTVLTRNHYTAKHTGRELN